MKLEWSNITNATPALVAHPKSPSNFYVIDQFQGAALRSLLHFASFQKIAHHRSALERQCAAKVESTFLSAALDAGATGLVGKRE